MNAAFDAESVSAFVDSELTEPERTRLEQQLGTNPAAESLLQDYGHLSQLVAQLPVAAAPANLSSGVRERIAAQGRTRPTANAPATSNGHNLRNWIVVSLSSVAVATVCLVLISSPVPQIRDESQQQTQVVDNSTAVAFGDVPPFPEAAAADSDPLPGPLPGGGEIPQVGAVLQFLERSEGRVAVVEVTVVDVSQALGFTEVLVARETKSQAGAEAAVADVSQEDGWLWGVYVQADAEQLTSLLQRMSREQNFRRFDPNTTVDVAALSANRLTLAKTPRPAARNSVVQLESRPTTIVGRTATRRVRVSKDEMQQPAEQADDKPASPVASTGSRKEDGSAQQPLRVVFVFRSAADNAPRR